MCLCSVLSIVLYFVSGLVFCVECVSSGSMSCDVRVSRGDVSCCVSRGSTSFVVFCTCLVDVRTYHVIRGMLSQNIVLFPAAGSVTNSIAITHTNKGSHLHSTQVASHQVIQQRNMF